MRYPKDMGGPNGVLNTSMTLVVALYLAMGFYGYLKFGEDIEASITLNLPPGDMYVITVVKKEKEMEKIELDIRYDIIILCALTNIFKISVQPN